MDQNEWSEQTSWRSRWRQRLWPQRHRSSNPYRQPWRPLAKTSVTSPCDCWCTHPTCSSPPSPSPPFPAQNTKKRIKTAFLCTSKARGNSREHRGHRGWECWCRWKGNWECQTSGARRCRCTWTRTPEATWPLTPRICTSLSQTDSNPCFPSSWPRSSSSSEARPHPSFLAARSNWWCVNYSGLFHCGFNSSVESDLLIMWIAVFFNYDGMERERERERDRVITQIHWEGEGEGGGGTRSTTSPLPMYSLEPSMVVEH